MRDLVGCFGDHAVLVAESACSGAAGSMISSSSDHRAPPPQNTVSCSYKSTLSSKKELLFKVTWHRNNAGETSALVTVEESSPSKLPKPGGTNCQILIRKKKGSRPLVAGSSALALHWDFSSAEYGGAGPEPTRDFYLVVMAGDKEFFLLVGDMCGEFMKKFGDHKVQVAEFAMYARREQVFGATLHSTKARFRRGGRDHEILIRCKGDELRDEAELYVCVDRKRLVNVKRVKWNFRGNQTIYIDGSAIDVLWDVHDWWFRGSPSGGGGGGGATFVFRTRSTLESRLWSEEELAKGTSQFTLLIQVLKSQ